MIRFLVKNFTLWNYCSSFITLLLSSGLNTCYAGIAYTQSNTYTENKVWKKPLSLGVPVCYWQGHSFTNFGDYLSLKLVERIVDTPIVASRNGIPREQKKLLAVGSIIRLANNNDVVWGSGINGKSLSLSGYRFQNLDVRAVRGPLTRDFLIENFNIECPEIYGDPALLVPYLFPEFVKATSPSYDFIIIPHYSELKMFPPSVYPNVVSPLEPWDQVIAKILDSKFVISSSLHGIVIAEAFGIPARLLKVTLNEPLFKYADYYCGTQRPYFQYATSVEEALLLGGEPPYQCDLELLYHAFPFDLWPESQPKIINFSKEL